MLISRNKTFISASAVAFCLALAASNTQPVQANWMDNASANGQRVYQAAFDTWSESDLRSFLLNRGIIAPQSTREQLAVLAKQDYDAVRATAASASGTAAKTASQIADQVYSAAANFQSFVRMEQATAQMRRIFTVARLTQSTLSVSSLSSSGVFVRGPGKQRSEPHEQEHPD